MIATSMRLPPQNLDAERCLLGAILLDITRLDEIGTTPDQFYNSGHGVILSSIQAMASTGQPVDAVTLATELIRAGHLENIGGPSYIGEILEAVPHSAHARHYAGIVREAFERREAITACAEAIESLYSDTANFSESLSHLEGRLNRIRETSSGSDIVSMADALQAHYEQKNNPGAIHPTGFLDLDAILKGGGLRDGQFAIVGGRPSSGKSIFTGQIALSSAQRGESALVISLEMPRSEIAERFTASVDPAELRQLPILMTDSAFEANQIASIIRLAKRRHGIKLVVLDYLQLCHSTDSKENRERQIAGISRLCKRLAMELSLVIVAGCQLNRESTKNDRPPRMSDLRESGSIEQDADVVILLHHNETSSRAIVAKQRNGPGGVVYLTFRGDLYRFENHTPYCGNL